MEDEKSELREIEQVLADVTARNNIVIDNAKHIVMVVHHIKHRLNILINGLREESEISD